MNDQVQDLESREAPLAGEGPESAGVPEVAESAESTESTESPAVDDDPEVLSDPEADTDPSRPGRLERLEHEGDIAADYLEELLEIADLDGDIDLDVEGDRATASVVGAKLPQLVGRDGEVLEALQELTRLAIYRETGERSRLMLDISGHRSERRTALEKLTAEVTARVQETGQREELDPMSPFERKVVHDAVAAAGLGSESEGVEPRRFVVVLPTERADAGPSGPSDVEDTATD